MEGWDSTCLAAPAHSLSRINPFIRRRGKYSSISAMYTCKWHIDTSVSFREMNDYLRDGLSRVWIIALKL